MPGTRRNTRNINYAAAFLIALIGTAVFPTTADAQLPNCKVGATGSDCFDIDGNITDTVNSGVNALVSPPLGPQALITNDPATSGNKELGPINGDDTKVGVIHTDTPPMLGLTALNQSTDLVKIYTQTAKHADGDIWYYFGYQRRSDNGAAFISIEFQVNPAPEACDYSLPTATVVATCNPWANRAAGDFMILFDGNGGSNTIIQRVFDEDASGNVFLPACPSQWPDNVNVADTDFCIRLAASNAFATYVAGSFTKGEMALNLTDIIFGEDGGPQCLTLANILPNTVTGNSDTADYKDTVLRNFDPIRNCGTVTITKVTVPAGLPDEFTYRLVNDDIVTPGQVFNGSIDAECEVVGTQFECAGLVVDGDMDTIENVLGGFFNLTEDADGDFTTVIVCTFDGETYGDDGSGADNPFPFPVAPLTTTACVITNSFIKTTPSSTSSQRVRVFDLLTISGITPGADSADTATVTIFLYSAASCSPLTELGTTGEISLGGKYTKDGTEVVLSTDSLTTPLGGGNVFNTSSPWAWAYHYSGDELNEEVKVEDTCNLENGSVTLINQSFNPGP